MFNWGGLWSNQSWEKFLILPHTLTNFEIQRYYQNEPRSKDLYSRNNFQNNVKDLT